MPFRGLQDLAAVVAALETGRVRWRTSPARVHVDRSAVRARAADRGVGRAPGRRRSTCSWSPPSASSGLAPSPGCSRPASASWRDRRRPVPRRPLGARGRRQGRGRPRRRPPAPRRAGGARSAAATRDGFTPVDETGRVTGVEDVYAVGDMTGRRTLAAQQAGVAAAPSPLARSSSRRGDIVAACPTPPRTPPRSTSSSPTTTRSSGPACGCCSGRGGPARRRRGGQRPGRAAAGRAAPPGRARPRPQHARPVEPTAIAEVKDTCAVVDPDHAERSRLRPRGAAGRRARVRPQGGRRRRARTAVRMAAARRDLPEPAARRAHRRRARRGRRPRRTTSASASSRSCA